MAEERFEAIIEKLDEIVEKLESGDLPLEDSLELFKQGVGLVKSGTTRLNDMEKKIEQLLGDVGDDVAIPFNESLEDDDKIPF
jgi:exodeoxyribonuclease VII small subunit